MHSTRSLWRRKYWTGFAVYTTEIVKMKASSKWKYENIYLPNHKSRRYSQPHEIANPSKSFPREWSTSFLTRRWELNVKTKNRDFNPVTDADCKSSSSITHPNFINHEPAQRNKDGECSQGAQNHGKNQALGLEELWKALSHTEGE